MTRIAVNTGVIADDGESTASAVETAAELGADAIEFFDWESADLEAVRAACDDHGVDVACVLAGGAGANIDERERPSMNDPYDHDTAIEDIEESIEAAATVGASSLILTVGPDRGGFGRATQRRAIEDVLRAVAPTAEDHGVTLVIEPLNLEVDHPGYFLDSSQEAFDIVRAVDSDRVAVLFDVYHQQITEGDVVRNLTGNVADVGHVHVADNPGRYELGTGEIDYPFLLAELDAADYDGYVGLEFFATSEGQPVTEAIESSIELVRRGR